jgi:hypothetical protein
MQRFILTPATLLGLLLPAATTAQDVPRLLRTYGDVDSEVLVEVKAAAPGNGALAVLTGPTPAVHVFGRAGYRSWGREGGGPAELASPVDLAWSDRAIVVLDLGHRKLVSYGEDGRFIEMRSVEDWANRLFLVDGDTILGTFRPLDRARAIVRVAGSTRDTIVAYSTSPNAIRLEAPGAPSFTVSEPFSPEPQWTVLPDGLIAIWYPERTHIQLLDLHGRERGRVAGVGPSLPVRAEDRETWFAEAIPEEFMGRRVFEPIRRRAREVVKFPAVFPPVLELQGDPSGAIWIRKNTAGSGQVWYAVSREGKELGSVRLPVGRRLLRVGPSELIVWGEDDLGVERIEVYERPAWARTQGA